MISYVTRLRGSFVPKVFDPARFERVLVNSYFFFLVLWSTRTKKTRTAFYLSQLVLFNLVNSYFIIGQVVRSPLLS